MAPPVNAPWMQARQPFSGAETIGPSDQNDPFSLGNIISGVASRIGLGGVEQLQPGPFTDQLNNAGRTTWQSGLFPESGSPFPSLLQGNAPQPPPQAAPAPALPRALANPEAAQPGPAGPINPYMLAEADEFLKPRQERRDSLTAQGYSQPLPDQFIKADYSKTRGRGFGQTWSPTGGGTVSEGGATTPQNAMLGRINQDTQMALAQQGLDRASLPPGAFLKPDPTKEKVRAALALSSLPPDRLAAVKELLNALGSRYDQDAINFGQLPPGLQQP